MASATAETTCFQDEIPVILNTFNFKQSLELETYIKGHHVYKEVWTPEVGEKLNVLMERDNLADKFAVCVKKDQTVIGHLKKGDSGKFPKTIFYFLRSDTYCKCYAEVSGKRRNLKDGKVLQVPCNIIITGQKKYVNIIKHGLQKINELWYLKFLLCTVQSTTSLNYKEFFTEEISLQISKSSKHRGSNYADFSMEVC